MAEYLDLPVMQENSVVRCYDDENVLYKLVLIISTMIGKNVDSNALCLMAVFPLFLLFYFYFIYLFILNRMYPHVTPWFQHSKW